MSSTALIVILPLLAAVGGLGLVAWHRRRDRERRRKREQQATEVARVIKDYFQHSQTEVEVECLTLGSGQVLALIDSAPQARFRYSHIIEIGLRNHLQKVLGVDLSRVYWRFTIDRLADLAARDKAQAPSVGALLDAASRAEPRSGEDQVLAEDSYLNMRALQQKIGKEYEVGSGTWEQFEAAGGKRSGAKNPADDSGGTAQKNNADENR